jgi:tRNA(Ile)-lysidine synthase
VDLRAALDRAGPSPLADAVAAWLRHAGNDGPLAVAYSGGADSTALLVEVARQSGSWSTPVFAFHVHHGLQAAADDFVAHAHAFCRALAPLAEVRFVARRVAVALPAGASVEAQAREARYDALVAMALEHRVAAVALAQHADDQVETMLIALGRGAGVAGLAGMGASFDRGGVRFVRPLLGVPGAPIRTWLVDSGIPFADDPSNADERFTRNRLRRRVLPALEQALPAFRDTFARSARLAAQARALLDEVAVDDAARAGAPPRIVALQALSRARQANALRYWLRRDHATTPTEAQMSELVDVIAACTTRGHGIDLRVGRGFVRRDGERLRFDAADAASPADAAARDT